MTTLYKTFLIESAEQAEALPIGTIVLRRGDSGPWQKVADRHMGDHFRGDGAAIGSPGLIGHHALVPIEAEAVRSEFTGIGFATERLAGGPFTAYYVHEREA